MHGTTQHLTVRKKDGSCELSATVSQQRKKVLQGPHYRAIVIGEGSQKDTLLTGLLSHSPDLRTNFLAPRTMETHSRNSVARERGDLMEVFYPLNFILAAVRFADYTD